MSKYNSTMKPSYYYDIYKENDFVYYQNQYLSPCQESVNIGTEENPLYSCVTCFNNSYKYLEYDVPARVTDENSKVSFCLNTYKIGVLDFCTEATYKIEDGKEVFNCTQCFTNYVLALNRVSKTYYCRSTNATTRCTVLYCKNCDPNNGYNCEECLPDYEVNSVSGSCVKKTEVIPAVTWKDIYKLNMNGEKTINNQVIHGPSLRMVGITSSQINTRHAFLIYLTFKIKSSLRNLEDEDVKIPAICEVLEGVDETSNDVNMVEYECIGNSTTDRDWDNYQLDNIEDENSDGGNSLIRSNLKEIIAEMKEKGTFKNIDKLTSDFTYEDLIKIVIFQMKENINNIKANKFKFNFKIEGQLNKKLATETLTLNQKFDLVEVNAQINCDFSVKADLSSDLSCNFDANKFKDVKTFSFKTAEINTKDNDIYLAKLNDIVLINSEKKDNKTVIIIVAVVCSVVGAALIGVGIYFLIRKIKSFKSIQKENKPKDTYKESEKNVVVENAGNTAGAESGTRAIKFENK